MGATIGISGMYSGSGSNLTPLFSTDESVSELCRSDQGSLLPLLTPV